MPAVNTIRKSIRPIQKHIVTPANPVPVPIPQKVHDAAAPKSTPGIAAIPANVKIAEAWHNASLAFVLDSGVTTGAVLGVWQLALQIGLPLFGTLGIVPPTGTPGTSTL